MKNLKNRLDELFSGSPNSLSYDTVTTSNIDYGQTDSFVLKQRKAKLKNRVDEQLLRLRKELKNIGRRGNSSSSQSILHNIELILGEDSIPFPQVSINTRQELLKAFRKYQETVYSVLERRIVEMELEARNCHDIESDPAEDLNDSPCDSVPLTVENESAPTISHDEEPIPDEDLNDSQCDSVPPTAYMKLEAETGHDIHLSPNDANVKYPCKDNRTGHDIHLSPNYEVLNNSPCESAPATFFSILYLLVSFFAGCGLMLLLLRIKKSKNENIKLSSDIASKISIDGDLRKEIESREVYTTHLEKGEYLIDFEDRQDENRHKTFNHEVTTKDCKLVFANFLEESSQNGKTIKCFIAGSKTLQQERDALRAVTCVMYNKWDSKNFRILSYTFEDFKKEHTLVPPQELYNKFIEEEADWALFIIDGEIGGITVDEYRVAMDSFKKNGRPKILALAKVGSENDEKVAEIRDEINKEHQYWTDYTDIVSLKYIFESTLNWDLIRMFQDK